MSSRCFPLARVQGTQESREQLAKNVIIIKKREIHELAKIVPRAPKCFTKSIYLPLDQKWMILVLDIWIPMVWSSYNPEPR